MIGQKEDKNRNHVCNEKTYNVNYYCNDNAHGQARCEQIKGDLKKLRDMNRDGANSQANVVKGIEGEDDLFFAINNEVAKTKRVMDFAASKNICRDREMFDTLKTDEEFSYFKLGNDEK